MKIKPLNLAVSALLFSTPAAFADTDQPELSQREVTLLTIDGLQFKRSQSLRQTRTL